MITSRQGHEARASAALRGSTRAAHQLLPALVPHMQVSALVETTKEVSCPQTVFAIVSFGAIVLTVNVVLLGGNIGFFQVYTLRHDATLMLMGKLLALANNCVTFTQISPAPFAPRCRIKACIHTVDRAMVFAVGMFTGLLPVPHRRCGHHRSVHPLQYHQVRLFSCVPSVALSVTQQHTDCLEADDPHSHLAAACPR